MVIKCLNTHYINDKTDTRAVHNGRKGVLEQAGGAE